MGKVIGFSNFLDTIISYIKNENTAQRTYTFPDRDGEIALKDIVRLIYHADAGTGITMTNAPNADTVIGVLGGAVPIDLTEYTQIRMGMRVGTASASANSPRAYPRYSSDGGSSFVAIGLETVVSGEAISLATTGWFLTDWIDLPPGAKTNVLLSARCNGGDGAADPVSGIIYFEIK